MDTTRVATDVVTLLEGGYAWAGGRFAQVRAEQLDRPTSCSEWNLREVCNHTLGAMEFMVAVTGEGLASVDPASWTTTDLIGADPGAAFTTIADRALAVWRTPWVLQRQCQMPFGLEPGWRVAQRSLTDVVVHGWDISRASGENADIPDALAQSLWEIDQDLVDESLRGGPFALAVAFTGGSASDRLVSFLGRTP